MGSLILHLEPFSGMKGFKNDILIVPNVGDYQNNHITDTKKQTGLNL